MSNWDVTEIDRSTLPDALLPTIKAHCRVDFADDDVILKLYTATAIAQLEHLWGFTVFGVEGEWTPLGQSQLTGGAFPDRVPTPIQPVSAFVATDEDDFDVSADFYLINKGSVTVPTYLATMSGDAFPSGITVDLTAGYATADTMPPEVLGAILQVTARLYEYREPVQSFSLDPMPQWMNDIMAGLWVPRC